MHSVHFPLTLNKDHISTICGSESIQQSPGHKYLLKNVFIVQKNILVGGKWIP